MNGAESSPGGEPVEGIEEAGFSFFTLPIRERQIHIHMGAAPFFIGGHAPPLPLCVSRAPTKKQ